jgi:F-type H+-transporting ATPase subunit epsilon
MLVEIISPEKTLFSGELKVVQLPGIDGSFEVMDRHAPMISVLKKGSVRMVDLKDQASTMDINGGVIEVLDNHVKILAE